MSDDRAVHAAGVHSYEPRLGHRLPHDPFNAIVGPRPIGWISTLAADGVANLAPYSFFNAFAYRPPIVGFSSEGYKDTVRNVEATGEFVWNLVTRPLAEAMNLSCAACPPEVDEFELAGLAKTPSQLVKPPRVAASPVAFECRVTKVMQLTTADGHPMQNWMTFGEVVAVHIDERLLVEGLYDTAGAQHVLRGGGPADYFEIGPAARFRMRRPPWPLP